MTKYFYTNRLDAFYMEQKWGVKYKLECLQIDAYVTTVDSVIRLGDKPPAVSAFVIEPDEPDEKWVVHEDSVHIFEPQVGDYVEYTCGAKHHFDKYSSKHSVSQIWRRNNTAFIMPEVEHDVI